ncbi:helix-turn-helix domain-containing protein [Gloeocapsopsis sp. IPPAS B-1203]|uniref:helix-turn-helix transcriptional regulator n=1 Tax=Gloeocapsopsis sp. IPPAS B-1203 TaxID=2049454 RepID=UPI000C19DC69|nr:helix-turn-helix domain-containing protein [Gloeocapsopsis sp. IPPAS B-1203]PIG94149.1 AraC family transcriptional regulator [Gloeocapsopsis sp. IPPAS B-1203]
MPLILSDRDLKTSYPTSYELSVKCSQYISSAYKRSINLGHGLHLLVRNYQLEEPLLEEIAYAYSAVELEFGFNLVGKPHQQTSRFSYPGSFLQFEQTNSRTVMGEWLPGQILKIDLHLTAPKDSQTLSSMQMELLPLELRQQLENPDDGFYTDLGIVTPEVHLVLQQILNCPYHGEIEQIYLQAKALELIAIQSAHVLKHSDRNQAVKLKSSDVDRLYHARDVLLNNVENPPSLIDLARLVGMNDCTFKRGFRQVFGTTAFGYLRKHRMIQARQFLLENKMSIAEVACAVGYSHPGYFAAAFRREFGINPSSLRRDVPACD